MKTSPVSFGSLMVFTLKDNKPKASIPQLMKICFNNNYALKQYSLSDVMEYTEETPDYTVHNAAQDFAEKLDKKYKPLLPKGSKKVILTEVDFYVNPNQTEKKYFLTAATDEDEKKVHSALSKSLIFFVNKFRGKR